jgi:hypothetical protein
MPNHILFGVVTISLKLHIKMADDFETIWLENVKFFHNLNSTDSEIQSLTIPFS